INGPALHAVLAADVSVVERAYGSRHGGCIGGALSLLHFVIGHPQVDDEPHHPQHDEQRQRGEENRLPRNPFLFPPGARHQYVILWRAVAKRLKVETPAAVTPGMSEAGLATA